MKHKQYGGSSAARQLQCPSWTELAKQMPVQRSSEAAEEGTMLHACMERYLQGKEMPSIGAEFMAHTITEDHLERLNMAYMAFGELWKRYGIIDYDIEVTVSFDDKTGGIIDILAWSNAHLLFIDWKFGQGMVVEAKENKQALFYHMCHTQGVQNTSLQPVIVIIQPIPSRTDQDTLKIWEPEPGDIETFKREYWSSRNSTGYNTGPYCQWCPGASICPLKTGQALIAQLLDPKEKEKLNDNLKLAYEMEVWARDVKSFAHEQLEIGLVLPDFKLVQKRGIRKWSDDAMVAFRKQRKIPVDAYLEMPKLLSPAKLEKKFDLTKLSAYISKTSSGTTLAEKSDPRDEIPSVAAIEETLKRI